MIERNLLVHANWAIFGLAGLCFLMEGFERDIYLVSCTGVLAVFGGFIGHLIINSVFRASFTKGEAALGFGIFVITALIFIAAWMAGDLSRTDYWSGLTLFGALAAGLPVYLSTRYGFQGAFAQIGIQSNDAKGRGR